MVDISNYIEKLDKILAIIGLFLSFLLTIYLAIHYHRLVPVLPGILIFASCLAWLLIRNDIFRISIKEDVPKSKSFLFSNILIIIYISLLILSSYSILWRDYLYIRPLSYFAIISIMSGIIAIQIFYSDIRYKGLIFIQIILLGFSITSSELFLFPTVVGIDPWWHQMFTEVIIRTGHISGIYDYSMLPIFHLIVSSASFITGLNYKLAALFSISFTQIIINGMSVFLFGRFLFNNYKIGLLASLLLVTADYHIYMSEWIIPTSIAATFIPIILYLLFKLKEKNEIISIVLSMLLMITLIMAHTITSACLAMLLISSYIISRIYSSRTLNISNLTNSRPAISIAIFAFFSVSMLFWWTFATRSINTLSVLFKWGFSIDYFIKTPALASQIAVPIFEQLFFSLSTYIFFSISLIGFFFMVSNRGNRYCLNFAFIALIPLAIGFFSFISAHSVVEDRWWYFAQVLLCISLSCSLTILSSVTVHRFSISQLIPIFLAVLTFFMILNPIANIDNNIYIPNTCIRYALTDGELKAAYTLIGLCQGRVGTDDYYGFALNNLNFNSEVFSADRELNSGNLIDSDLSYFLIRNHIIHNTFKLYQSLFKLRYNLHAIFDKDHFNRIYDSSSVYIYRRPI